MIKINDFEIYQSCLIDDELGRMWFVECHGVPVGNFFSLRKALMSVIYMSVTGRVFSL